MRIVAHARFKLKDLPAEVLGNELFKLANGALKLGLQENAQDPRVPLKNVNVVITLSRVGLCVFVFVNRLKKYTLLGIKFIQLSSRYERKLPFHHSYYICSAFIFCSPDVDDDTMYVCMSSERRIIIPKYW